MNIKSIITVGAVAFGLFGTAPAEAEFVIDFEQVGSDVVASGSGSIDTAGLTFFSSTTTSTSFGSLTANVANFSAGTISSPTIIDVYTGLSGPNDFGQISIQGQPTKASATSGSPFVMNGSAHSVALSDTYVSGSAFSNSSTFANNTFSSLGLKPGVYTYTFGSGPTSDSIVVEVGSSVPEPATWAMMILGLLGVGFTAYRKRTTARFA
jgi:hypothetical protein